MSTLFQGRIQCKSQGGWKISQGAGVHLMRTVILKKPAAGENFWNCYGLIGKKSSFVTKLIYFTIELIIFLWRCKILQIGCNFLRGVQTSLRGVRTPAGSGYALFTFRKTCWSFMWGLHSHSLVRQLWDWSWSSASFRVVWCTWFCRVHVHDENYLIGHPGFLHGHCSLDYYPLHHFCQITAFLAF